MAFDKVLAVFNLFLVHLEDADRDEVFWVLIDWFCVYRASKKPPSSICLARPTCPYFEFYRRAEWTNFFYGVEH